MKIQVAVLAIMLTACKAKPSQEVISSDSTNSIVDSVATVAPVSEYTDDGNLTAFSFDYHGVTKNSTSETISTIDLLSNVLLLSEKSIELQDSVEYRREGKTMNSFDSAMFRPAVERAYQAILSYKNFVEAGSLKVASCPQLLDLTRITGPADSSYKVLPKVPASRFFVDKKFFFLGGAPFVYQISPPDGQPFTDPRSKPERRYSANVTENSSYLLRSMYAFKKPSTTIAFGSPLSSYEMGPQEVNGIGSIIHRFPNRIQIFLLTETGSIRAELLSIEVFLTYRYGCISDLPQMEFACSELIDPENILAMYISLDSMSSVSCSIVRGERIWTADLNGDGVADLACISNTYSGASSDTLAEQMWFINYNGEWKIIDWGMEPDCT